MSGVRQAGGVAGQIVIQLVQRVLIQPVQVGRLRRGGWPPGLTPTAAIAVAVYLIALIGAVLGGQIRHWLPHDNGDGFPSALLPVMVIGTAVVVALVSTGALHAPWPLRVTGILMPLMAVLATGLWTSGDIWWATVAPLGCWVLVAAVSLWRWSRPPAWWEYVVLQLLVGASLASAAWLSLRPGLRSGATDPGTAVDTLLVSIAVFAIPTAVLAGIALSELAFSTSVWLVETVSSRVPSGLTAALTAVLAAVSVVTVLVRWSNLIGGQARLADLGVAVAVLAVSGLGWWQLDRLSDRRRADSTRLTQLVPAVRRVGVVAAVLISLPLVITLLTFLAVGGVHAVFDAFGLNSPALPLDRPASPAIGPLVVAVAAAPACLVLARRGRRGSAELVLIIGVLAAARGLDALGLVPMPALDDVTVVSLLIVLATAATWLIRGRLTGRRVEAVAAALLLSIAITNREVLSDPLGLLLGGSTGALLTLGLIWRLLTGAEEANEDSARFPRSSRTILVLANLAITALVFAHNQIAVVDLLPLDGYVQTGADVLGTGLLLAGLWAVLGAGCRDEEVCEPVLPSSDVPNDEADEPYLEESLDEAGTLRP